MASLMAGFTRDRKACRATVLIVVVLMGAAMGLLLNLPAQTAHALSNDYVVSGQTRTGNLDLNAHFSDGARGYCQFGGNAVTMISQSGPYVNRDCANVDLQVINRGYACSGCQNVRLYWGSYYTGAWACITPQWLWEDAGIYSGIQNHAPMTFSFGSGQSGYAATVWNNVASLKWTGTCS